ncbi:MAG: hypothetical protein MZU84_06035 [Sphingobacterium sp.]|nr:hypothetical protein [Sphingobacterium sp.]
MSPTVGWQVIGVNGDPALHRAYRRQGQAPVPLGQVAAPRRVREPDPIPSWRHGPSSGPDRTTVPAQVARRGARHRRRACGRSSKCAA